MNHIMDPASQCNIPGCTDCFDGTSVFKWFSANSKENVKALNETLNWFVYAKTQLPDVVFYSILVEVHILCSHDSKMLQNCDVEMLGHLKRLLESWICAIEPVLVPIEIDDDEEDSECSMTSTEETADKRTQSYVEGEVHASKLVRQMTNAVLGDE